MNKGLAQRFRRPVGGAFTQFANLMSVKISNDYFNRPELSEPDLAVAPTGASEALAKDLGLVVRTSRSGLTVACNMARQNQLFGFLKESIAENDNRLIGTPNPWLSFTVGLTDPDFIQFTELAFDFNPSTECLYASNTFSREAVETDAAPGPEPAVDQAAPIVISPFEYVNESKPLALAENQKRGLFPPDSPPDAEVLVRNVWGNVVLDFPKEVPAGLLSEMPQNLICRHDVNAWKARVGQSETIRREVYELNFYLLNAGKYTIEYVGFNKPDEDVIYLGNSENAICFVDLFFSKSPYNPDGVYPVTGLDSPGGGSVQAIDYALNFSTRLLHWNYILVPAPGEQLSDLEFLYNGIAVPFTEPEPIVIAGGRPALSVMSVEPIEAQDKPTFWLELKGRVQQPSGLRTDKIVLASALPTPEPAQIAPLISSNSSQTNQGKEELEGNVALQTSEDAIAKLYVYL